MAARPVQQRDQVMPDDNDTAAMRSIAELRRIMEKSFDEIKGMIRDLDIRVQKIENQEAGCQPLVNSRLDAAWRRLDEHDAKLDDFGKSVIELEHSNQMTKWLGGITGGAVILWLLGKLLGLVA